MKIAVGCDHAGFPLKDRMIREVKSRGHEVLDLGAFDDRPSDYPDFARSVAESIVSGQADRGLLICGSGVGASIAANKVPGVRAALCHDTFSGRQGVEDDNMNVLCLGARIVGADLAAEIVHAFLNASFSTAERHSRRLGKVIQIEHDAAAGRFSSTAANTAPTT